MIVLGTIFHRRPGTYHVVVGDYDRATVEGSEMTIAVEEVRLVSISVAQSLGQNFLLVDLRTLQL